METFQSSQGTICNRGEWQGYGCVMKWQGYGCVMMEVLNLHGPGLGMMCIYKMSVASQSTECRFRKYKHKPEEETHG
jgi:hypothetical protein